MNRTTVCISLAAGLALPLTAQAKKLDKLSCAELVEVMTTAGDEDDRADAAEYLGEKGCTDAIPALADRCVDDEDREVCNTAVAALAELGTSAAHDALVGILGNDDVDDPSRKKALNKLMADAPERVDGAVHHVLGHYRKLDQGFTIALIDALVKRDLRQYADLTILIAKDRTLKTKVRKKALEAADTLNHPLIHEAYISLLDDSDKKLRKEACDGLARSGLPSAVVAPALERVVREDDKGDVRAAALKALKQHAHTGLLPLIHTEVVSEKHIIAWNHAVELLIALGDESSVDVVHQVLLRDDNLPDEGVIALIHMLVRICDPRSAHALASLEARTTGTVDSEAVLGRKFIEGGCGDAPYVAMPTGVVIWDVTMPPPDVPTLQVELDANGVVVWIED